MDILTGLAGLCGVGLLVYYFYILLKEENDV